MIQLNQLSEFAIKPVRVWLGRGIEGGITDCQIELKNVQPINASLGLIGLTYNYVVRTESKKAQVEY